jgi:hypothetical protein
MNDNTLLVMAAIACVAYVPLTKNIKRITGRENKVERGSIVKYFLVFLVFGLLMVASLLSLQGQVSATGHVALIAVLFLAANLIAHALFGRKMTAPVA